MDGRAQMDIMRAEQLSQDRMHRNEEGWKEFTILFDGVLLSCEWIDPYFGLMGIKQKDGELLRFSVTHIPGHAQVWY